MTLMNEPIKRAEIKPKYCRFKKNGIKYIDYKDPDFLLKFINEQGKLLPDQRVAIAGTVERAAAPASSPSTGARAEPAPSGGAHPSAPSQQIVVTSVRAVDRMCG